MDKSDDTAEAQKREEWPNTIRSRKGLDSALEAGEKSGESDLTIHEIFKEEIAKSENGAI